MIYSLRIALTLLVIVLITNAAVILPARKPRLDRNESKRQSNSETAKEELPSWVADVTIGSQGKTFTVVLDTGSGVLGVYGSGCSACVGTGGSVYNPSSSQTSNPVGCNSTCSGEVQDGGSYCSVDRCGYSARYGDGSTWFGPLATDTIEIAGQTAVAGFAYFSSASSSFIKQYSQGIIGLSYPGLSYPPSVIGNLLEANGLENQFWLQFNRDGTGELTLGLPSAEYSNQTLSTVNVYPTNGNTYGFYVVKLAKMTVGGETFATASDLTGETIVDSGTTTLLFPQDVYDAFVDNLSLRLPCRSSFLNERTCALTQSDLARWPNIVVTFDNGVTATMYPPDYIQFVNSAYGDDYYQLGLSAGSGGLAGQTILGDPFLSGRYTGFDRDQNLVHFTETAPFIPNSSSSIIISTALILMASLFVI